MADKPGYWGLPTSSIVWCEEDYAVSFYVAEWWNTISNLPPILIGALAITAIVRRIRAGDTSMREFIVGYLTLISVFLGSAAFHATLTYTGQLMDELPMIYGSLLLNHVVTPRPARKTLGPVLILVGVAITAFMILMRDSPTPLQLSYGALVVTLLARSIRFARANRLLLDSAILSAGCLTFLVAFILWICDQRFCDRVRYYRFHAWWHVLSGTGTYLWIQFAQAKTLLDDGYEGFVDKGLGNVHGLPFGDVLPFVVPASKQKL